MAAVESDKQSQLEVLESRTQGSGLAEIGSDGEVWRSSKYQLSGGTGRGTMRRTSRLDKGISGTGVSLWRSEKGDVDSFVCGCSLGLLESGSCGKQGMVR